MSNLSKNILTQFGNKLRLRVCGIHIQDNKLLLIKHKSLGVDGTFWAPPGGGMEFGETALQTLQREMKEETGLHVRTASFTFVHEFLNPPLHAIELFFTIDELEGELIRGHDPEMHGDQQLIEEVAYLSLEEIQALPDTQKHYVLVDLKKLDDLVQKQGYSIFNPSGI